jgi:GH24 family phage-related lysozyme (muramidase)
MIKYIQRGDYAGAANQFDAWNGSLGKEPKHMISGLVVRNFEERQIWTSGNYTHVDPIDPRINQIMKKGGY